MSHAQRDGLGRRPKVLLYACEMHPYRFALYQELSKLWDLTVVFSRRRGHGRVWTLDPDNYTFKYKLLRRLPLGLISVNPSLPVRALGRYDAYVITAGGLQDTFGMLVTTLAARTLGRPTVLWTEWSPAGETVPEDWRFQRAKRLLEKKLYEAFLLRFSDRFITHGPVPAVELMKRGVAEGRIFVSANAVPEIEGYPPPAPREVRDLVAGKRVILTAAYLRRAKGTDGVIRAFRRLEGADLLLVVMGDGHERTALESLACGDSRIRFVGYCEGEKKWALFSAAEVFVLFSYYEAWGLVVNEAMQCGCAIVTTDRAGCAPQLVKGGGNGFVVRAGDEEALHKALQNLAGSPGLARSMGDKSKQIIAGWGIGRVARDFEAAVRACGRPQGRAATPSEADPSQARVSAEGPRRTTAAPANMSPRTHDD